MYESFSEIMVQSGCPIVAAGNSARATWAPARQVRDITNTANISRDLALICRNWSTLTPKDNLRNAAAAFPARQLHEHNHAAADIFRDLRATQIATGL